MIHLPPAQGGRRRRPRRHYQGGRLPKGRWLPLLLASSITAYGRSLWQLSDQSGE